MKYKDMLICTKEKISEALAPFKAREMEQKGRHELAKLESEIAEHEQQIADSKSKFPIDFNLLIKSMDELELKVRRRKQFEAILIDLFGK